MFLISLLEICSQHAVKLRIVCWKGRDPREEVPTMAAEDPDVVASPARAAQTKLSTTESQAE